MDKFTRTVPRGKLGNLAMLTEVFKMQKWQFVAFINLVLIAGGAAAWYFLSDPFSDKVGQIKRQITDWTPENILKDPVGYLTWSKDKCDKTEKQLKARQIGIKRRHSRRLKWS